MNNEKLIETIKKLLALASSPNENEAKLAMKRAQDLISKYSISIIEDLEEPILEVHLDASRLCLGFNDSGIIFNAICPIFGTTVVKHPTGEIGIFGYKTNITVAIHATQCIINQLNSTLQINLNIRNKTWFTGPTYIHDYWLAATRELKIRFNNEMAAGQGLVLYDKALALRNKLYNIISGNQLSFYGSTGIEDGKSAGREAQLRKGVQKTEGQRKLL